MLYEYDATEECCPVPLVKLRLMLKKMTQNDSCIIRIADKGSKSDIPKLLTNQGYLFKQINLSNSVIEISIDKKS